MRKILNILLIIFCGLGAILSFVFVVLDGRLLFAGDWLIYDSAFNGFIRYLFRFLLATFALIAFVLEIMNTIKKNNMLTNYLPVANISLFISGILIAIFATNYVGLASCLIAAIVFVLKVIIICNDNLLPR